MSPDEPGDRRSDRRATDRLVILMAGLCVLCFVGVALISVTTLLNRKDIVRQQAVTEAIQGERVRNTREGCVAQNKRNTNTVEVLQKLYLAQPPPEREAARARRSLEATILLIDALVPYRNCRRVVEDTVASATDSQRTGPP